MKRTIAALVLVSISSVGCAQLTPNEVAGAVIGGIAGSTIGGGTGRLAATAAGAVIGANVGRQVSPHTYVYPGPVAARGYPPGYYPAYPVGSVDGTYPIYERPNFCADEQYIDGLYNPPAAQAYCRGKIERERAAQSQYEREAYERGRRGLR